jgi:release factor glutamine methyltransferase
LNFFIIPVQHESIATLKKSPARLLLEALAQPAYRLYSASLRKWSYDGLDVLVFPGIFHPGWFVTSRMLLDRIERTPLDGKRFLELGCGTATQACRAAQLGAISYASDVAPAACRNAEINAERNSLKLHVVASDIFDQLPEGLQFDVIFVNPPFLAHYPEEERDFAFCCGEEFEYYISLFSRLGAYLAPGGELIMALAKSCEIDRILAIADLENIRYERIDQTRRWAETNYLYRFTV